MADDVVSEQQEPDTLNHRRITEGKRMLSSATSKLSKSDIPAVLRKEDAWIKIPQDKRQTLYMLLPQPRAGDPPHDIDVHPLKTSYRSYIEEELRLFQDDLTEGKEGKKWREQAMEAGREMREGKFDEWKEQEREERWGTPGDEENVEPEKAGLEARMAMSDGVV